MKNIMKKILIQKLQKQRKNEVSSFFTSVSKNFKNFKMLIDIKMGELLKQILKTIL